MDNRPIGFFDSGLGGLTAVRALRRILPDENGQLSIEEDWDLLRDAMIIW